MIDVAIILGSTRPGRRAEPIAKWIHGIADKRGDARFELVDIADFTLPFLDEPTPAMMQKYTQPHTRKMGRKDRFLRRLRFRDPNIVTGFRHR